MFRKFDPSNDISTSTQVKASVQRSIKCQISSAHPSITEELLDELLPKKSPLVQYKVGSHLVLYCQKLQRHAAAAAADDDDDDEVASPLEEPIFFQHRDGPILPTLKLVHKYPALKFTQVTVDKGAIPFLLGGAHVMCPGLTNKGGVMPPDGAETDNDGFDKPGLKKGDGVVVYAEGKEFAMAVGVMSMSTTEIRDKNKGIGIEIAHFLGDGLYQTDDVS